MVATRLFSVSLAMVCVLAAVGCGGKDEAETSATPESKAKVETSAKDGEGFSMSFKDKDGKTAKIQMGGDDDSFSMNIEGGEGGVQMKVGKDATIPEDFPKDVPMYKGIKLNLSQSSDDGHIVSGTVTDDMDTVAAFFKEQAAKQGWEEEGTFSTTGEGAMTMLSYKKGERTLSVTVSLQDNETMIQVVTNQ